MSLAYIVVLSIKINSYQVILGEFEINANLCLLRPHNLGNPVERTEKTLAIVFISQFY